MRIRSTFLGLALSWLLPLALGCSSLSLVRLAQPDPGAGAPKITQLIDLGVSPLPGTGPIDARESDKAFTPGEWLAVVGDNLDGTSAVSLDGRPLPVAGYLRGGSLLLRVPRGFSPRKAHELTVKTNAGQATAPLSITSYLVVASPNGNALELLPLSPETKEALEQSPKELGIEWARGHAFSPDGGWLYIIESPQSETDPNTKDVTYPAKLRAFQLGAASGPRAAWDRRVVLANAPTALAMLGPATLAVLAERELVVMDVRAAEGARELGRQSLTQHLGSRDDGAFTDIVAVNQGRQAVVLESMGNRLVLVELSTPASPTVACNLDVAEEQDVPVVVSLVKDATDDAAAWLVLGPNIRIGTEKARRAVYSAAGFSAAKPTAKQPAGKALPRRALRVRAQGNRLTTVETRNLPDGFNPLHASSQPNGDLLVSGVNNKVFQFSGIDPSSDGAKRALDILGDSLQMGRIIKLGSDSSVTTLIQGTALYFNLDMVPDTGLAYFTWRLGVGGFPPGPKLKWGVELENQGFADFGAMDWKAIIPPYAFSIFAAQ